MPINQISIQVKDQQQWLDYAVKQTRYCHYFTVSIADKNSPIGYSPYFYTEQEAIEHKAYLTSQNPNLYCAVTSGLIHSRVLETVNNRWSLLHKQRIEQLNSQAIPTAFSAPTKGSI